MQIIVILCFLSYLFLVLQYKLLAGEGAKDLTAVLLRNGHLQLLNKRALTTIPLMSLCIIVYSTQDQYHFLQAALSEKESLQTTLLVSICLLVSVYSTDQFKKIIRTIGCMRVLVRNGTYINCTNRLTLKMVRNHLAWLLLPLTLDSIYNPQYMIARLSRKKKFSSG